MADDSLVGVVIVGVLIYSLYSCNVKPEETDNYKAGYESGYNDGHEEGEEEGKNFICSDLEYLDYDVKEVVDGVVNCP